MDGGRQRKASSVRWFVRVVCSLELTTHIDTPRREAKKESRKNPFFVSVLSSCVPFLPFCTCNVYGGYM